MKNGKLSIVLKGIIKENPVLVLVLGTCATLATTVNVISALSMGAATAVILICSNVCISALRKIVPDSVRIPAYIVVIAGFVSVVQMLMHAYLPELYEMLGVFLALIVVNCIILGRAEMFARKNTVIDSALDGLGMGLGFIATLLVMATIREVLGSGTFAGMPIPFLKDHCVPILAQTPGGFFVFGCLIAVAAKLGKGNKKAEISCSGCPSAAFCGKCAKGGDE